MIKRIKELVSILNQASDAYYNQNKEIMSNKEYDTLYDELLKLEKETGLILTNSPTQKVGYSVLSNLTKVQHSHPLLSLDKTKEMNELKSWLKNQDGLLSWKEDGLTTSLEYDNGELLLAATRGNGEIGEDITHNAKTFKNLPIQIPFKRKLRLRGESVIKYTDFHKINELLVEEEQYKNPRNLCSGSVRQLNSEIAAKRNINFYAFTLIEAEGMEFKTKQEQLEWLRSLGFEIVEYLGVTQTTIEGVVEHFKSKVETQDIPSDGLVLTFNDLQYSNSLGRTSKFPKDSIAFKWSDEIKETRLINIEWDTSRTGAINPVAIFEPTELEGTTVTRASLHNVSIIEDLELGVGDIITVYKANMIIPQVEDNLTRSNTFTIPTECPACGGETEIRQPEETKVLYCTNPNCRAQLIRSISHFVSRDAMNIMGLSEQTIEKFVEEGFIKNFVDIYRLGAYEKQIKQMDGFGLKSYNKLNDSIEKSKSIKLPNLIYALGINKVGLKNAKVLSQHFKHDIERIKNASLEELRRVEGFKDVVPNSVFNYFCDKDSVNVLSELLEYVKIEKATESTEDKILEGKAFVITGNVEHFKNRKELQSKIEELGGKVLGGVSGVTSFLINNSTNSTSSKNTTAKKLGVPIITEQDFLAMISK